MAPLITLIDFSCSIDRRNERRRHLPSLARTFKSPLFTTPQTSFFGKFKVTSCGDTNPYLSQCPIHHPLAVLFSVIINFKPGRRLRRQRQERVLRGSHITHKNARPANERREGGTEAKRAACGGVDGRGLLRSSSTAFQSPMQCKSDNMASMMVQISFSKIIQFGYFTIEFATHSRNHYRE